MWWIAGASDVQDYVISARRDHSTSGIDSRGYALTGVATGSKLAAIGLLDDVFCFPTATATVMSQYSLPNCSTTSSTVDTTISVDVSQLPIKSAVTVGPDSDQISRQLGRPWTDVNFGLDGMQQVVGNEWPSARDN